MLYRFFKHVHFVNFLELFYLENNLKCQKGESIYILMVFHVVFVTFSFKTLKYIPFNKHVGRPQWLLSNDQQFLKYERQITLQLTNSYLRSIVSDRVNIWTGRERARLTKFIVLHFTPALDSKAITSASARNAIKKTI